MPGTSQGSAHPETRPTSYISTTSGASPETNEADLPVPQPFAAGEWEALVAAAVANVAAIEGAPVQNDPADAAVCDLLDAQPEGTRAALSLPVPAGACARVPTWRSRRYWLSLCEWIATRTDRGRAALKRHGIAATTFLRVCFAHAEYAESTTGRHVSACLATMAGEELSIDKLKRGRRVLKALELGAELARGKKLDAVEREAAARLYRQAHGQVPVRLQIGAASVWALSAPAWAVEAMPAPEKPRRQPQRRSRRRRARPSRETGAAVTRPASLAQRSSPSSAPQSSSGSSLMCLSVRKDHQARERAGGETSISTTTIRPLALQRAAAELVDRIPALRTVVGIDEATGHRRGHIGSVCDLLVEADIDTDRWTGIDIAQTLNRDGVARGWTWPTAEAMSAPLQLVAYRLSRLDWSGPSPTECELHGRMQSGETPTDAAHRLARAYRRVLAAISAAQAPPASDEHRRAVREKLAADLAEKRALG